MYQNSTEDLVNLIQQTIRDELNIPPKLSYSNRSYQRNNRPNYNNNRNNIYPYHNNYGQYNQDNRRNDQYQHNQPQPRRDYYQNSQSYSAPQQPPPHASQSNLNGQSNTQQITKPINQQTKQHPLNVILNYNEYDDNKQYKDLYSAVRPERPPEVLNATPYAKAKVPRIKRKQTEPTTTKKITTRNHLEEIPITTNPITIPQDIEMETDASVKSTTQEKQKKPRIKRTPPKIDYQIGKDVLDQKANISVRDLITVSPAMRRQLVVYGYCMKLSQTLIVCTGFALLTKHLHAS
ncbi:hypothetical protein G6F15_013329 [Rhizopus arrhizus]|nr:hypothetical protein G6F15_013329 [Rhizopus arrhizus]KAG0884884.1 hypothetical protein G6F34_013294 [Rhizopus arrhizus]KAG0939746.1 hypothetical protein G6F31_015254 [Rhizopus arrhizus]